jgi:hypothetical protein
MKQPVNQTVTVAGYGMDAVVCKCQRDENVEVWCGIIGDPIDPARPIILRVSAGSEGNLAALLSPGEAMMIAAVLTKLVDIYGETEGMTPQ